MTIPLLAQRFCQVCWVVSDLDQAEMFFTTVMGVKHFVRGDTAATASNGTYLGSPGDWVIRISFASAGDVQIELIQHISGTSIFQDTGTGPGGAVHHLAYWIDQSEYESTAQHLEAAGYPLLQGFSGRIGTVGYFDTRPAIGVMTEIIGASEYGHAWRRSLKQD